MATSQRLALVTGANRGLGLEIAWQLARAGLKVLMGARDLAKGEQAAAALRASGLDAVAVELDVTDLASVAAVIEQLEAAHAPIDVLVNNAAIMIDGPGGFNARLADLTAETLRQTFETNVFGPAALTRVLLPKMLARKYGRIVNMSSMAGQLVTMTSGFPAYRMSKSALNALTRISASEAGRANVKINACSPGWARTDMGGAEAPRTVSQGADTAVWLALLPDDGPTGRFFHDREPISW